MKLDVFVGPSGRLIDPHDKRLRIRNPVVRGDLVDLVDSGDSNAVLIVDGEFGQQPSVLHKEILYALSKGIYVAGCSSMGALRAVEMNSVGMKGFGRIFNWYLRGALLYAEELGHAREKLTASELWLNAIFQNDAFIDEDDVALLYAPKPLGFAALSEPLVNLVFTTLTAPVTQDTKRQSLGLAKSMSFRERSFDRVIAALGKTQIDRTEIGKLEAHYKNCNLDQKSIDASDAVEYCLETLQSTCGSDGSQPPDFIETTYWKDVRRPW